MKLKGTGFLKKILEKMSKTELEYGGSGDNFSGGFLRTVREIAARLKREEEACRRRGRRRVGFDGLTEISVKPAEVEYVSPEGQQQVEKFLRRAKKSLTMIDERKKRA